LELLVKETTSKEKAWNEVKQLLDNQIIVGLKLDCYYLEYFKNPFHFAGHYVAIYRYDNNYAYLIDTKQQGIKVKTSLESLSKARSAKGSMSSKNLFYTISKSKNDFNIKDEILSAIRNNAKEYINPPIANIGYKGIEKTSKEIINWYNTSKNVEYEFKQTSILMEKAGTGGSLFRNLYRDFLKESYDILKMEKLNNGYRAFEEIALLWNSVSKLFDKTSKTKDIKFIYEASNILKIISQKEKDTMVELEKI
jgi:hypothetical protein